MTKEELLREAKNMGYNLVYAQTPTYKPCPKCGYVNNCRRGYSKDKTIAFRECPRCGFKVEIKTNGRNEVTVFNKIKVEWNEAGNE